MISGLRMLPRVQVDRQRQRDDGSPFADEHMDCTSCKAKPDHEMFAPEWRCGWLDASAHRDGMAPHEEDVCPGYSIQMPEVIEAAQALHWRNSGSLAALYEDMPLPPVLVGYVNALAGAVSEVEADTMRAAREEAKRGAR